MKRIKHSKEGKNRERTEKKFQRNFYSLPNSRFSTRNNSPQLTKPEKKGEDESKLNLGTIKKLQIQKRKERERREEKKTIK